MARRAIELIEMPPIVIDIDDVDQGDLLGETTYEDLLIEGDPLYRHEGVTDEWEAIALNYTSGTTGEPKGVVYHHRGAYLNSLANIVAWDMPRHPNYLWTLPMFHCNGWCFPWTIVAQAGTQVCLRNVRPDNIWQTLRREKITHLCGAPIVLTLLIDSSKLGGEGNIPKIDMSVYFNRVEMEFNSDNTFISYLDEQVTYGLWDMNDSLGMKPSNNIWKYYNYQLTDTSLYIYDGDYILTFKRQEDAGND